MSTLVNPQSEPSNERDLVKEREIVTFEAIPDSECSPTLSPTSPRPPVIYNVKDLLRNSALLRKIVSLINDAFTVNEEDFEPELRFPKDQDLIDQFGNDLICTVIWSREKILATASITPWREPPDSEADVAFRKMQTDDYHLVERGQSYEVRAVAVANESASRKKGLASLCIKALQDAVFARNEGRDFLLWVHTEEKVNGAYWRRRGFENVLIEWKPVEFWGALREFQYTTLVKRIHSE